MELTEADAGAERAVAVGEELVVRLEENRTTGFRWQLADLPDGVALVDDGYEAPAPGRPGQGGVRRIRVRVTRPGTHRLCAELRRSWEGGGAGRSLEFLVHGA